MMPEPKADSNAAIRDISWKKYLSDVVLGISTDIKEGR